MKIIKLFILLSLIYNFKLVKNKIGSVGTLLRKNTSKIKQFYKKQNLK